MPKYLTYVLVSCALLLAAACGADSSGKRSGGPIVTSQGDCATENLTATCSCAEQGNIPGRQTCHGGQWGACECVEVATGTAGMVGTPVAGSGGGGGSGGDTATLEDPPGNRSDKRFAWQRTAFDLGICKAGHYIGNFTGTYASPAAFQFPVPVASASFDGKPGLEFWLEKVPGSGEVFKINMGKMQGTANGLFPFSTDLTGDLDCATKKFNGQMTNGKYTVFGTDFMFEGTLSADYDKLQNKFITGVWVATEPSSTTTPPAGGNGTWDATWSAN